MGKKQVTAHSVGWHAAYTERNDAFFIRRSSSVNNYSKKIQNTKRDSK